MSTMHVALSLATRVLVLMALLALGTTHKLSPASTAIPVHLHRQQLRLRPPSFSSPHGRVESGVGPRALEATPEAHQSGEGGAVLSDETVSDGLSDMNALDPIIGRSIGLETNAVLRAPATHNVNSTTSNSNFSRSTTRDKPNLRGDPSISQLPVAFDTRGRNSTGSINFVSSSDEAPLVVAPGHETVPNLAANRGEAVESSPWLCSHGPELAVDLNRSGHENRTTPLSTSIRGSNPYWQVFLGGAARQYQRDAFEKRRRLNKEAGRVDDVPKLSFRVNIWTRDPPRPEALEPAPFWVMLFDDNFDRHRDPSDNQPGLLGRHSVIEGHAADFEGIPPVDAATALRLSTNSKLFTEPQQRLYSWDVPVKGINSSTVVPPIMWVRVQGVGENRYLQIAEVEFFLLSEDL